MKVYVLSRCTEYDGDVVIGVFTSIEKLKKHTESFGYDVPVVWSNDDSSEWIVCKYGSCNYSCDGFELDEGFE